MKQDWLSDKSISEALVTFARRYTYLDYVMLLQAILMELKESRLFFYQLGNDMPVSVMYRNFYTPLLHRHLSY